MSRISDLDTGYVLVIRFNELLQLLTTSNYDVLANSLTPALTTALPKFFTFTSRCLITDLSSIHSSAPLLMPFTGCWPQLSQNYVTADHESLGVKQHLEPNTKLFAVRQRVSFMWGAISD
jgi:hypothetical protein